MYLHIYIYIYISLLKFVITWEHIGFVCMIMHTQWYTLSYLFLSVFAFSTS